MRVLASTALPLLLSLLAGGPAAASPVAPRAARCPVHIERYDATEAAGSAFELRGLRYEGFEVVPASAGATFFEGRDSANLLAVRHGVVANLSALATRPAANASFYPSAFYVGCAALNHSTGAAAPAECQLTLATPVVGYGGPQVVSIYLAADGYSGRALRAGDWGGPATPYINVSLYDTAPGVVAYFGALHYSLGCANASTPH